PAVLSPAQRGKVPKAEGGALDLRACAAKSAPFSPFGAASPALQGKRQHPLSFPLRSAGRCRRRKGALLIFVPARQKAPPSAPSGQLPPLCRGSEATLRSRNTP